MNLNESELSEQLLYHYNNEVFTKDKLNLSQ